MSAVLLRYGVVRRAPQRRLASPPSANELPSERPRRAPSGRPLWHGGRCATVVAECRSCVTPTLSMAVASLVRWTSSRRLIGGARDCRFRHGKAVVRRVGAGTVASRPRQEGASFPVKTLALLCKARVQRFQGTDRWHGEFRSAAQSWDEQERVIEAHGQPSDSATCSSSFICSSRTISMPELRAASRASELASSMRSVSLVRP